ncbi:MAG: hypothetical protein ACMUEM_05545 [Flavobacteriales bacterium AspAUS03]
MFFFLYFNYRVELFLFGFFSSNTPSAKELARMKQQYANLNIKLQQMERFLINLEEKDRIIYRFYFAPEISLNYLAYNDKYMVKQLEKKVNFLDCKIQK